MIYYAKRSWFLSAKNLNKTRLVVAVEYIYIYSVSAVSLGGVYGDGDGGAPACLPSSRIL